jgi:hypothetical protein
MHPQSFFFENNAKKSSIIFYRGRERQMKRVKETQLKRIISLILILWVPMPPFVPLG